MSWDVVWNRLDMMNYRVVMCSWINVMGNLLAMVWGASHVMNRGNIMDERPNMRDWSDMVV